MQSDRLTVQRARSPSADMDDHGTRQITFRPVGATLPVTLAAARIIDCRGIRRDPEHQATPLIAGLLASGQARVDNLRISLDVTDDCQVIGRDGTASRRILAIGPASRAAFREITAIPDIRERVARLATGLAGCGLAQVR